MPVGLEVVGDAGSVQIDQDYMVLQFSSKGSCVLNSRCDTVVDPSITSSIKSQVTQSWINTNGVGQPPFMGGDTLVAFRPKISSRPVGVAFGPYGPTFIGWSNTSGAPEVDWWAFNRAQVRSSGLGMEVYDASGNIVFSDAQKAMPIVAIANDVYAQSQGITAGAAGTYALCVGTPFPGVGSYTYQSGQFHYVEGSPMWEPPSTTGFAAALTRNSFARLSNDAGQFGITYGNTKATLLLVDVAGL